MQIPSREEFIRGYNEFQKREKREPMYKTATFLLKTFWRKPPEMADSLGVLLLTWNQAFYRYGTLNFDKLETCISNNLQKIEDFRKRDIFSLSKDDENNIMQLFNEFLEALKIDSGKSKGKKSAVAVAKALHLLAPSFFPLWDREIAHAYGCHYSKVPAETYLQFCNKMKGIANEVKNYIGLPDYCLLKTIDEYNYAKYTKKWI